MTQTNETFERQVIQLVAADRAYVPVSSLDGKLKRMRVKLAQDMVVPNGNYVGERVFAKVDDEDRMKARGMKEGIEEFERRHPQYGSELRSLIEEKRAERELHLYFGVNPGCRLTADDYLGVMADLGFTEAQARTLYGPLLETSRAIARKRDEVRSVMLASTLITPEAPKKD
ncbi:hypothetical protein FJZ17_01925 [Candidatus Pacearchaeota archaeon]|nr:hypothetical protein [Candidatus Pacearchaeota archaeon]